MPTINLLKQDGTTAGEVVLNETIFGIEPNKNVVFDVVTNQQATQRQEHTQLKTEVPYVVVVKNHGVKKVLDVLVLVLVVRQSGVVVE